MATTLKLRKLDKNGAAIYAIDGVRGSIWVSKAMLAGDPPQELEVNFDGFAAPGTSTRTPGPRNATPEQIEKVLLAQQKAEERAAKAAERAEKARLRAEKYRAQQTSNEPVAQ